MNAATDFTWILHQFRIRYGWIITKLPVNCECGAYFDLQHALSCKKGGFVSLRHNHLRNITASLLNEVCKDVMVEPPLQTLTAENFEETVKPSGEEARKGTRVLAKWSIGIF